MNIVIDFDGKEFQKADLTYLGLTSSGEKYKMKWNNKEAMDEFKDLKLPKDFKAKKGQAISFTDEGIHFRALGLGEKKDLNKEPLRKFIAKTYKATKTESYETIAFDLDSFETKLNLTDLFEVFYEAIALADYTFDKYKKEPTKSSIKKVVLYSKEKKNKNAVLKAIDHVKKTTESMNFTRDLVNEAPNVLHSEAYAKIVEKDVKANLKGVKVKILNKAEIKKENMNLFLSVNAGSGKEPRLVHLTYTPKKVTKNTKHFALVGKGITFDTGGYSLKPGASMMGMKFDMGGSATLYGAFRAAVLNNSPHKITCLLAMTDNAVNENATVPDSIVKGRNGMTVEILNTDAEGRLIMSDTLDYASDLKPDYIIDAATLTGACLVALGQEVCALMTNSEKFGNKLKKSAKEMDEYLWELPIIDEWRDEMKSDIADLRNIGKSRFAGTATAGAFLENFVGKGIEWIHLDIAGVCDSQKHLPYCPPKGGSGIMVRSIAHLLCS